MAKPISQEKSARISTRIDPELKYDTEIILNELGLTPSEAIILFYKQILLKRGIPFEIQLPEKTLKSIINIEKEKNLTKYKNKQEMYKKLGI